MRLRPLLVAFCLLLTVSVGTVPAAYAQDGGGTAIDDLEKALQEPDAAAADPSTTSPTPETDDAPIPDAVSPSTPAVTAPAETTPAPAAGTVTPAPPAYLVPGQSAAVQPISGVASLTEPDLPLEPVRLAALIAVLLASLLVGGAALLRGLGLRTAVASPIVVAPRGGFARVRERTSLLADDVRDFLRHSR